MHILRQSVTGPWVWR